MNPFEVAYGLAIGIIIVLTMFVALNQNIPTGIVGTALLAGIGMCQLAAIERFGETPNWRAALTILEALIGVWATIHWLRYRASKGVEDGSS